MGDLWVGGVNIGCLEKDVGGLWVCGMNIGGMNIGCIEGKGVGLWVSGVNIGCTEKGVVAFVCKGLQRMLGSTMLVCGVN